MHHSLPPLRRFTTGECALAEVRSDRADSRVVITRTEAEVLDELRWLPTDLLLLKERLSPLPKLYQGGSKQWQALRRVACGAMGTLLDDLRWVREGLHCSAADARPVPPSRAADEPSRQ